MKHSYDSIDKNSNSPRPTQWDAITERLTTEQPEKQLSKNSKTENGNEDQKASRQETADKLSSMDTPHAVSVKITKTLVPRPRSVSSPTPSIPFLFPILTALTLSPSKILIFTTQTR
ncbi:hypothetical protein IKF15_03230 [Candidatus Saccharibacteria bacterium]|nr:hypothetical protein [Candidatus Saccharibacteria bacterium]